METNAEMYGRLLEEALDDRDETWRAVESHRIAGREEHPIFETLMSTLVRANKRVAHLERAVARFTRGT